MVQLVRFLRAEESERLGVIDAALQATRIDTNSVFVAQVINASGEVTIRWRVTDWFFLVWGWMLVGFFVIGVASTVIGLFKLSISWALVGLALCSLTLIMSRAPVLMYRPRRRTVLRLLRSG